MHAFAHLRNYIAERSKPFWKYGGGVKIRQIRGSTRHSDRKSEGHSIVQSRAECGEGAAQHRRGGIPRIIHYSYVNTVVRRRYCDCYLLRRPGGEESKTRMKPETRIGSALPTAKAESFERWFRLFVLEFRTKASNPYVNIESLSTTRRTTTDDEDVYYILYSVVHCTDVDKYIYMGILCVTSVSYSVRSVRVSVCVWVSFLIFRTF